MEHNKVKKHYIMKKGKCSPCSANNRTNCCKQVISSSTFKSQHTNKSYIIIHEVNCSNSYVIQLMECTLCKKQYVAKSEVSFNIRLNNYVKTLKNLIPDQRADTSMNKNHVFSKRAKFIVIDKLENTTRSVDILRQRLIDRENFQI